MQMMNYHKVSEQDRIKFESSMLFTVIEESYNRVLSGAPTRDVPVLFSRTFGRH